MQHCFAAHMMYTLFSMGRDLDYNTLIDLFRHFNVYWYVHSGISLIIQCNILV